MDRLGKEKKTGSPHALIEMLSALWGIWFIRPLVSGFLKVCF